ncbi:lysophospholipid acyltransferase family protein [Legionella waltersii]|uniref:Phospholipid/glycerol acyltransferase domain-containing protein n=1 Tax=Legionella waltersii TaxID=66969 RepID=A0A0W1ALN0_9GAMM|nr:1-acyl-sn-glycerol-3-phosphate acyltransferase [Legionella waltersii]KTD82225.1 hypothetical protein Lwal_0702 [Legionella waltersii]SNV10826.1 Uncharacterised protein [Legionella waltersii]
MYGFDSNDNEESSSSDFTFLYLLVGVVIATLAIAKFAESKNRLHFESRFARILAGMLVIVANLLHTKRGDLEITNNENKLLTVGPHRTGWEGIVVASKMEGTPPRFFATDAYNFVPGVAAFMKMFKTIPVKSKAIKDNTGRSANADTLELASQALNEKGCVALFPQGNFARIGQDAPRVYTGAAQLALKNKIAIHVVRLDGFWSLQNPLIPMFVRNSSAYRAFLSAFHVNNVRATMCCVIDFHLQPENENLSEKEMIDEICARLYAYYRHTQELTDEQIDRIKDEINNKTHLEIWHNKVKQDELGKQLVTLKKEEEKLEKPTTEAMRLN